MFVVWMKVIIMIPYFMENDFSFYPVTAIPGYMAVEQEMFILTYGL